MSDDGIGIEEEVQDGTSSCCLIISFSCRSCRTIIVESPSLDEEAVISLDLDFARSACNCSSSYRDP